MVVRDAELTNYNCVCWKKIISVFFTLYVLPCISFAEEKNIAQLPSNPIDVNMSVLKVTLALFFVVLAIFASAWIFRRFSSFSSVNNDALTIVASLSLGNRERIVLLQVGEEQIMLGVTPGKIETLHVLAKPLDISSSDRNNKGRFSNNLQKAIKQWSNK